MSSRSRRYPASGIPPRRWHPSGACRRGSRPVSRASCTPSPWEVPRPRSARKRQTPSGAWSHRRPARRGHLGKPANPRRPRREAAGWARRAASPSGGPGARPAASARAPRASAASDPRSSRRLASSRPPRDLLEWGPSRRDCLTRIWNSGDPRDRENSRADLGRTDRPSAHHPRPTKGIFVAMTVIVSTFASRGRLAM